MQKLFTELKIYLIVCLLFISFILIGLLTFGKIPFHLIANQFNSPFQDFFFKYFTNIGDGLFAVVILLVLFFLVNIRTFFIGLATFLISGIVSQVMKKLIFIDQLRPTKFFSSDQLHLVDGVVLHSYNSFPSGHSTTAFAMLMFLSYVFKNKLYQFVFAIIACLTAYSRVYLSQHFFEDVAAGGIVGIVSFIIAFSLIIPVRNKLIDKKAKFLFKT
jgi:membrane-associated phospholipid phosphatase